MNSNVKILNRIKRKIGDPNILEKLEVLERSDLHSLLLEVYKMDAKKSNPNQLIQAMKDNRFIKPNEISQKELIYLDRIAYKLLPEKYQAIELSPATPFGINSILTKLSQNNVISTTRSLEVLADTTTMLCLLCAQERINSLEKDKKSRQKIDMATSHRIIRQQKFEDTEGFTPHFRAFSLCSAGRDLGHEKFEIDTILEHICFYLNLITSLSENETYHVKNVVLYISNIQITEELIKIGEISRKKAINGIQHDQNKISHKKNSLLSNEVTSIDALRLTKDTSKLKQCIFPLGKIENRNQEIKKSFEGIKIIFDLQRYAGIGYYSDLCFKIVAENEMGKKFPLVDGGTVDWTQKMVASKKERALVSGFGSELFCNYFKRR